MGKRPSGRNCGAGLAVAGLALLAAWGGRPGAPAPAREPDPAPPPGAVRVVLDLADRLDPGSVARLARRAGIALDRPRPGAEVPGIYAAWVPEARVDAVLHALGTEPLVEGAERDVPHHAFLLGLGEAWASIPAALDRAEPDPLEKFQWHMKQVRAREAWELARGTGQVVAVIDTGVAFEDHGSYRRMLDLAVTPFVAGWDVFGGTPHANDGNGHGTHVAGTVAQSTGNGFGGVGVAPGAQVMPVKVLTASGAGTSESVALGIRWAADHGADVLNLSLGSMAPSGLVESAVKHAQEKGCLVVAAAGNTGRRGVCWPAAHRDVLAVAATDLGRTRAFYSSFGPEVGLAAPGGDTRADKDGDGLPDGVYQNTFPPGKVGVADQFSMFMGTSMASPHVAGAAALVGEVLAARGVPRAERPARIRDILQSTAAVPADGPDPERYGAGILDVRAAVEKARGVPLP